MKQLIYTALVLGAMTSAAAAEPAKLSDAQMAKVSAGAVVSVITPVAVLARRRIRIRQFQRDFLQYRQHQTNNRLPGLLSPAAMLTGTVVFTPFVGERGEALTTFVEIYRSARRIRIRASC
jgi:hypothetical protein